MSTLEDRRKADRKRQETYRQRQLKAGKKALNVMVSEEAFTILQKIKQRDRLTNSQVVELALLNFNGK